ncbi:thioesterase family protein [Flexivirga caeni]|uniref:Thioesterase family protein n=1 Tax=Flexivirga caeni TaxID=2294115 RepID=A0A3M9M507_9MICO|nr:thioesterase family protein [Flexivirga caeni]RNI20639.1 thioesterase family protein [Flexivirga caeni]
MTDAPNAATPDAYYRPVRPGVYQPTTHVQGAWQETEQHMAPISGLITHELAMHEHRAGMQIGRICFEILGMIPLQESTIRVETIRPGRTIELLEATLTIGGRDIIRARAWRLAVSDLGEYAGSELPAMSGPEHAEPMPMSGEWPGGYIRSLQVAAVPGGRGGRRQAWVRSSHPLIDGVEAAPLAAYTMLVDTANGIATRVRPDELMFPNVDLTLHFVRRPDPAWVGLDTSVTFGPDGLGLTSSVLHDVHGPVGRVEQCLTVRRPPAR